MRIIRLLSALALIVGLLGAAPSVAAVSCSQLVYFYDGANATGGAIAFCAEDYPLTRTPSTGASFDQNIRFNNGLLVDNRISSIRFASTTAGGYAVALYSSYYLNDGKIVIYQKPTDGTNPIINLSSYLNNQVSSFAGCGTSCSDEPHL